MGKDDADDEGNQLRYMPNEPETVAVATDEDLHPGDTSVTVEKGASAKIVEPGGDEPGVFRACEAVWGGPLYRSADPRIATNIVAVRHGCDSDDYAGREIEGNIVLTDRAVIRASHPAARASSMSAPGERRSRELRPC